MLFDFNWDIFTWSKFKEGNRLKRLVRNVLLWSLSLPFIEIILCLNTQKLLEVTELMNLISNEQQACSCWERFEIVTLSSQRRPDGEALDDQKVLLSWLKDEPRSRVVARIGFEFLFENRGWSFLRFTLGSSIRVNCELKIFWYNH